jgi:Rhs element Vgr protein
MNIDNAVILSNGEPIDATYELLAIDIAKEVNRIPTAQLWLVDGDVAPGTFPISDTAVFEPGQPIEIRMSAAGSSDTTVFKGVVIKHGVEWDEKGSLLTVELKDIAIKLALTRKHTVYRQKTDDQLIGDIIGAYGLTKGAIAPTQPPHPEIVQYYCTDWDFILSRADAHGRLVAVDDGSMSLAQIDLSSEPKHAFEYRTSTLYNFEIEVDVSHQPPGVESLAWDIKRQTLTQASQAKAFDLTQGNLTGTAAAAAMGAATAILADPVPLLPDELQAWADGRLARSRLAMIRGRLCVPGSAEIKPLDIMEVAGVGSRFTGKTLVTGIRHRIDAQGWRTDVQFGLSAERFAARADIADLPAAGLLPAVHGLQIGIVDAFADDPDKQLRVKVMLPGVDAQGGAIWARLMSPDAGKNRGFFFRPEKGDEVVVGFFNDDPRQAVILGAMYSSINTPPKDVSQLTKDNIGKAIVTKTGTTIQFTDDQQSAILIKTPDARIITLDDEGKMIQIADQYGNAITMSETGITIKSAKDLMMDSSGGNVEIKGKKVDVQ